MGQKINPIGLRVAVHKNWQSRWYAEKRQFSAFFHEDLLIRERIMKRLAGAAVPEVGIERYANRVRATIFTARPGIVIGHKGQDIEKLREELAKRTGKEVYLEIKEIRQADLNAQLVAENIALQLERRVSFRRAVKKAIKTTMDMKALGIKVSVSGRLGGAELARRESHKEGSVPLHTLRALISYGLAEARTVAGKIGVKVWICTRPDASASAAATGGSRRAGHA